MRGLVAVLFALSVMALLPDGAGAATICVGEEAAGCEASAPSLQAALDAGAAAPGPDRVALGAGRFGDGPFVYPSGGEGRIEVVGQGPATVLTAAAATGATVLSLAGAGESAVSSLTVRIPAAQGSTVDSGIAAGTVANVRVSSDANGGAASAKSEGVILSAPSGSLRSSVVEMVGGGEYEVGVRAEGGSETTPIAISDSRVTASTAIVAAAQATNVVRDRVLGNRIGVFACNGPVVVEDTLVRVPGSAIGVLGRGDEQCGSGQASITVRQVTVIGSGVGAGGVGVELGTGNPGQDPRAEVLLSILRGLQTAFEQVAGVPDSSTGIQVGASDFEAARHSETGAGGTTFSADHPNIDADPLFTSELLGEFTLRPGSPAIDSTFSPPLAPDESTTDLNGNPRVLDGNGDGVAARDMGAFEAPAIPPAPDRTPPDTRILHGGVRKRLKAGRKGFLLKVAFVSSEAGSTFECRLDAGRFLPCSSPFEKRIKAGVHRFEVRAVDAAGNVDPTPARETLRIARAPHRHHAHRRHRRL